MPALTRREPVRPVLLSRSSFAFPDYVDHYSIRTDRIGGGTPLAWARALVEDAAGHGGQLLWRGVLGLRLKRTAARVGGWAVAGQGDDWLRLEASSWLLRAELVIQAGQGELSVGTFVLYRNPLAAAAWPPLARIHRRAMPGLLRKAVRVRRP